MGVGGGLTFGSSRALPPLVIIEGAVAGIFAGTTMLGGVERDLVEDGLGRQRIVATHARYRCRDCSTDHDRREGAERCAEQHRAGPTRIPW